MVFQAVRRKCRDASYEEGLVQQALRVHGKIVGKRPELCASIGVVVCLGIACAGWWSRVTELEKVLDSPDFFSQWIHRDSRTWQNAQIWDKKHGDDHKWSHKVLTTVISSKGSKADNDTDVLTRDGLQNVLDLQRAWHTLSVKIEGKTYTADDLCVRGHLTDEPSLCDGMTTTTTSPAMTTGSSTSTTTVTTTSTTVTLTTTRAPSLPIGWEYGTWTSTTVTTTTTLGGNETSTTSTTTTTTTTTYCPQSPKLPCLTISPIQCFGEQSSLNDAYYQSLDPFITLLDTFMLPYTDRPMFSELTDVEIKGLMAMRAKSDDVDVMGTAKFEADTRPPGKTRGCYGFTSQAFFPVDMMATDVSWGDNDTDPELLGATGLRLVFFLDGAARIKDRLSHVRPDLADEESIAKALKEISNRWDEEVQKFAANSQSTEAVYLPPWQYLKGALDQEHPKVAGQFLFFAAATAGAMTLVGPCLMLRRSEPQASHGWLTSQGLVLVWISLAAASSLFLLSGLRPSLPAVLTLPVFGWGLGTHHVYALVCYFRRLGPEYLDVESEEEIVGEVLATGGTGIFLSCLAVTIVFGIGSQTSIPALSDFCIGMVMVAITDLWMMMVVFAPLLVQEVRRIGDVNPDRHPAVYVCQKRNIDVAEKRADELFDEEPLQEFMDDVEAVVAPYRRSARWLSTWTARAAAGATMGALVGIFSAGDGNLSIDYSLTDLLDKRDAAFNTVERMFGSTNMFSLSLCFNDVEVSSKQTEMLELFRDISETPTSLPAPFDNYLTTLYKLMYQEAVDTANFSHVQRLVGENPLRDPYCTLAELNESFRLRGLAENGIATNDVDNFTAVYERMMLLPNETSMAWRSVAEQGSRTAIFMDLAGAHEFLWENQTDGDDTLGLWLFAEEDSNITMVERMTFSLMHFFMAHLGTPEEHLSAVRALQASLDSSPLKDDVFIYGWPFNEWQVLDELRPVPLQFINDASLVVLILALLILFPDVVSAVVACVVTLVLGLGTYGCMALATKCNAFFLTAVLASMGLLGDTVAHFAAGFALSSGSAEARLGTVLRDTLPAASFGLVNVLVVVIPFTAVAAPAAALKYVCLPFLMYFLVAGLGIFLVAPVSLSLAAAALDRSKDFCRKARKVYPKGEEKGAMKNSSKRDS